MLERKVSEVPWHPFLVHLPIGGWLMGTLLLWMGILSRRRDWCQLSWICLALAAVASIPAVLAGQADLAEYSGPLYIEVKRHRDLGNLLPWLMCGLVLLNAHFTFRKKGANVSQWPMVILATLVSILIIYAGLLGGKLVYILGVAEAILGAKKS